MMRPHGLCYKLSFILKTLELCADSPSRTQNNHFDLIPLYSVAAFSFNRIIPQRLIYKQFILIYHYTWKSFSRGALSLTSVTRISTCTSLRSGGDAARTISSNLLRGLSQSSSTIVNNSALSEPGRRTNEKLSESSPPIRIVHKLADSFEQNHK